MCEIGKNRVRLRFPKIRVELDFLRKIESDRMFGVDRVGRYFRYSARIASASDVTAAA